MRAGNGTRSALGRFPCWRRKLGLSPSVLLGLGCSLGLLFGAGAQAQEFGSIDANGLPAAGPLAPFFTVVDAQPRPGGEIRGALRSSVLLEPISGSQPSPDPDGTDTAVVSCLWLQEILLQAGLGAGFDLSLGIPIHLLQSGQGLTGPGIGDTLAPIAFGDLRIGLGVGFPLGSWLLRPFATVYLPTGQEAEFAGERLPRADVGAATMFGQGAWTFSGSIALRVREVSQLSNVRWSPQGVLALGTRYTWDEHIDTTLELTIAPTLSGQPEPESGSTGYLLPAEILVGAHHRGDPLVVGLFLGTGLPISIASGTGGLTRAPTSPTLRTGIEVGMTF